jgi:hypothetical protein
MFGNMIGLILTFHLVNIISLAGESLDKYIQAHSEAWLLLLYSEVTQLSVYVSYSDTLAFHCIFYYYMLPLDRYSISNVNMNHAFISFI